MKTKRSISRSLLADTEDLSLSDQSGQQTKFDLYVQSRKVQQLTIALDKFVTSLSKNPSSWLIENQELIEQFLDDALSEAMLVLDGMQLDEEGVKLSISLMGDIRRALSVVEQMV
ncbi:MAG TPA: hypothetical protein PLM16_01250, partial [Candidatus Woesebacteria bacterium]|nr:hypothetical protein [Candidatus Woesebacteria bacterium]